MSQRRIKRQLESIEFFFNSHAMANIGIPIKLLHEAQGLLVTLELKSGQTYRGKLIEIEDSMNVQLREVTMMDRQGQTTVMENVFLRGSQIRFFIIPDNLKFAPYLSIKTPVMNPLPTVAAGTHSNSTGAALDASSKRGGATSGRARGRARR
jgi:small nuclear ribonucleoprotein D3